MRSIAGQVGDFTFVEPTNTGGAEDYTYMMRRVQENGGQATHIGIGADFFGIGYAQIEGRERVLGHHTPVFDIDERALKVGVKLLTSATLRLLQDG
jgi:aminobenzoyl-glutamate utilization protein A